MTRARRSASGQAGTTPGKHGRVQMDGHVKQALETGRTRIVIMSALFVLAFFVVGLRLFEVMALNRAAEPRLAKMPETASLHMARADIVDRNGVLLATNLATASLYAEPRRVLDPADAARRLVRVLPGLSEPELRAKLSGGRSFVWLQRNLTPGQQYEVNRLGLPGLQFLREERRVYPHGPAAAHVLGMTNVDNEGLSGVEKGLDDLLRTSQSPVRLSVDIRVQSILRDELSKKAEEFSASGAAGIMMDVTSGEIIALVSLPDFDPNQPGTVNAATTFNRITLGVYEMGSTFKTFSTALALEKGTVTLSDQYETSDPIRIARFTIRDFKPKKGPLSVPEIFMYSSNIGTAKMAMDVGTQAQRDFLDRIGLLSTPHLELPEIGSPLVPARWRDINTMTISFGHGLAVTPLQMATATSAIVNGGTLPRATLLAHDTDDRVETGPRIISPRTSEKMRHLLRLAVEHGTGSHAVAPGYLVGGKTGTAEKTSDGRYGEGLLSSFSAAFPINDPRYVLVVLIDDPKGTKESFGYATGGWTAAPVVGSVVEKAAPLLGVRPTLRFQDPKFEELLTHVGTRGH
ncbi:MAG: penicillin-binding protein 2 [Alphaproteobacteria bacterium]